MPHGTGNTQETGKINIEGVKFYHFYGWSGWLEFSQLLCGYPGVLPATEPPCAFLKLPISGFQDVTWHFRNDFH